MKHGKSRSLYLVILQSVPKTKRLKIRSFTILLLTSVLSFTSLATEVNGVDTDKYLLSSCNVFKTNADNDKTLPCVMYIKGFFNGLLNAGNPDVAKIDENNKKPSTFVERAYASRVGKKSQRTPLSHSCITVDELKDDLLDRLSDDSASTFVSVKELNSFLLKALKTACSSGNKSH